MKGLFNNILFPEVNMEKCVRLYYIVTCYTKWVIRSSKHEPGNSGWLLSCSDRVSNIHMRAWVHMLRVDWGQFL